jgi:hypothetical protein
MSRYFSLFDLAIAGVPVLIFCIWQLISINREIAKDKKPPDSPEGPGHPIGEHRLDDR